MAKLDFFTIHTETEGDYVSTSIELNFVYNNLTTVVMCNNIADDTNITTLFEYLKTLFTEKKECTYEIKQCLCGFNHMVSIHGGNNTQAFILECDGIDVTEYKGGN